MINVKKNIGQSRVSFSPSFYKRAYDAFKNGSHRELISMMKEAETDTLITGCLSGRQAGYQQMLSFEPFDPDNDQDKERAEWFQKVFKKLKQRTLFKAIMNAKKYKFQVIEFEFPLIEGLRQPISFEAWDQKYFVYDIKGDGKLKIDQNKKLEDIPDGVLVVESDDMPIMLPPLKDYILKEFGVQAWASFIETFGEGFIIGYYPAGSGDDIKQELDTAVNALAASSRGTAPKGTEIEIHESKRNTGDHEKFVKAGEKGIAISICGHANAVEQSGAQIGESSAPFKPAQNISIDDLYFIDEAINELIQITYDLNWTDQRYPTAITAKPDSIGMEERRKNLDMWYRMGFTINPAEGKKLGIMVDPDDEPQKNNPFGYGE
ncbi:MAG: DUF935 family protein [Balneolaceae bacterium]